MRLMYFDAGADAYYRFMGRFSEPLAHRFADLVGVAPPARALDVGAGAGALTQVLVDRLGPASVHAAEPSEAFVGSLRTRLPGVDVEQTGAESLPYADDEFDLVLAQLVVHFMTDPVQGIGEMRRVARPGAVVAASVWDHDGHRSPLSPFWDTVLRLDAGAEDESWMPGIRDGHLVELFEQAGLEGARQSELTVEVPYSGFDEWWSAYTLGVGPAGKHVAALDDDGREQLRRACADSLPAGPFSLTATAWTAAAVVR